MKTAKIVTIKPQFGQVEYDIYEDDVLISHGHLVSVVLTAERTGAELQALVDADAIEQGLLPEPI